MNKKAVRKVLDEEMSDLFEDLIDARKRAVNGDWSMECDWIVERIAKFNDVGARWPDPGHLSDSGEGLGNQGILSRVRSLIE